MSQDNGELPIISQGKYHKSSRLSRDDADLIVRTLILLNAQPRFGPKDSRLHFDSYSVASELDALLKRTGWSWQMLSQELKKD